MRVISRKRLAEFWKRVPSADAVVGVELYCGLLVTVFNVRGNNYRLISRIIYPYRRIYVKTALTHREYDQNNWKVKLCREYTSD